MSHALGSLIATGHVLVADDDPVFRTIVARQLVMLGAQVIEAEDGASALPLALSHPIDLALVDLDMPCVNGSQLIGCLRGHPQTCHIPIVVITTHADNATVREAMAGGATAYLTKPVHWSTFSSYIGSLLRLGNLARAGSAQAGAASEAHEAAALQALAERCRRLAARPALPAGAAAEARDIALELRQIAGPPKVVRDAA